MVYTGIGGTASDYFRTHSSEASKLVNKRKRLLLQGCLYDLVHGMAGAIIGDGNRKSWDPHVHLIWDNFAILELIITIKFP